MTSSESHVALRVSGLKKRFGRKQALDGVGFSIPQGCVAGFLGPNGAGKTTTLRMLLGLAFPDEGSMELLNVSMPGQRATAMERVGAMVERPSYLDSFSGFDNLKWFGSLYKPVTTERINEMLQRVGLTDSAHRPFGVYSTGMKQRLGVAAAILHQPSLLILDEPTSGMDPQGRAQMRDILKEIHAQEGTTIFLSSHLIDEIQRLCDYVVIVDKGKTVREGKVAQLLNYEEEHWEIRLPPAQVNDALQKLSEISVVISASRGPRGIDAVLRPDTSSDVNKALVHHGLAVSAMIPHEASLEDTFLALTESDGT